MPGIGPARLEQLRELVVAVTALASASPHLLAAALCRRPRGRRSDSRVDAGRPLRSVAAACAGDRRGRERGRSVLLAAPGAARLVVGQRAARRARPQRAAGATSDTSERRVLVVTGPRAARSSQLRVPARVRRFGRLARPRARPARAAARPLAAAGRPDRARRHGPPAEPPKNGFDERDLAPASRRPRRPASDRWRSSAAVVGSAASPTGCAERSPARSRPASTASGAAVLRGCRARRRRGALGRAASALPRLRPLPPARGLGPERRARRGRGARARVAARHSALARPARGARGDRGLRARRRRAAVGRSAPESPVRSARSPGSRRGRPTAGTSACSGALVLLAWNPYTLLDPGFQLSFAAVAAIFVLVPRLLTTPRGLPAAATRSRAWSPSRPPAGSRPRRSSGCSSMRSRCSPSRRTRSPRRPFAPLLALALRSGARRAGVPAGGHALAWLNGWFAAYLAACARLVGGLPGAQVRSGRALLVLLVGTAVGGRLCLAPMAELLSAYLITGGPTGRR